MKYFFAGLSSVTLGFAIMEITTNGTAAALIAVSAMFGFAALDVLING